MKFYSFYYNQKDSRVGRFQEEAQQRGLPFIFYNILHDILMTNHGVYDKKKKSILDLAKGDVFWMLSNSIINHHIEKFYDQQGVMIWPNSKVEKLSDKMQISFFLDSIGIPTPKTVLITEDGKSLAAAVDFVSGFPCVIKKTIGTSGQYVGLVNSQKEIEEFIKAVFNKRIEKLFPPLLRMNFILQQYIKEAKGTDYRVLCLKDEVLGAIRRKAATDDFRANVSLGGTAEQIAVDPELEQLCKKIMKEGRLFYAGIDFIKSDRGYLAIEINTSAQFEGFEKATGINVAGKIVDKLLECSQQ